MVKSIAILNPGKTVYFFYGVNESSDHSFQMELQQIRANYDNVCITTFYNMVRFGDVKGLHYDYEGFINVQTILQITQEIHLGYYICGPGGMMSYIRGELEKLGVSSDHIHTESFNNQNDQSLEEQEHELASKQDKRLAGTEFSIEFLKSGKTLLWDKRYRSILEFAEGNDIEISSGCLFGDCGTCLTEIKEGNVHYLHQTLITAEKGKCLPCSCVPTSDVVLEA